MAGRGRRQDVATINPATEKSIADVASASPADVDAAVAAARAQLSSRAARGRRWRRAKEGEILWKIADLLTSRADEVGTIETLDNGKPIFESQFVDTPAAAECLYYFAGWSGKVTGETIPISSRAFTYTLREPIGVVGTITPWNFPLMLAVWKIAPALACGNTWSANRRRTHRCRFSSSRSSRVRRGCRLAC